MQAKLDRAILERDEARTELKQNKAMVIAWSGLASFYADAHHGKLTASGSRFDMNAFTAANRTLRFGSLVLVLDTRHFTWVLVEIADRGPAKWTERDIDLSRAAARQLGMEKDGIVPVVIMMIQGRVSDRD